MTEQIITITLPVERFQTANTTAIQTVEHKRYYARRVHERMTLKRFVTDACDLAKKFIVKLVQYSIVMNILMASVFALLASGLWLAEVLFG